VPHVEVVSCAYVGEDDENEHVSDDLSWAQRQASGHFY
jgi:hypothetical protein